MLHRVVSVSSYSSLSLVVKELSEKPYICNECDKEFSTQRGLKVHKCIVVYDDDDDLYACPICSQQFNTIGKLVVHTKAHITSKSRNVEEHSKRFHGADDYQSEMTSSTEGKLNGPEECLKSCQQSSDLISDNTDVKTHQCDVCHESFPTYSSLKRHKRVPTCFAIDPGLKQYSTRSSPEEHSKSWHQDDNLKSEMITSTGGKPNEHDLKSEVIISTGGKPIEHEEDLSFSNKSVNLASHDTEVMPYTCDYCGRCFNNIPGMKRHTTRIHRKKYSKKVHAEQKQTNKQTTDDDLKLEMITSTRLKRTCFEKPNDLNFDDTNVTPWRCGDCGRYLSSKQSLQVHGFKIHGKEHGKGVHRADDLKSEVITSTRGKRKCSEKPSDLNSHNTDVTPYKCDDCSKCFASKRSLKGHAIRSHTKVNKSLYAEDDSKSQMTSSTQEKRNDKKDQKGSKTDVDVKLYKCENCAKCFRTCVGLLGHDKVCTVCKICHKSFSRKHKLAEHLLSHDGRFKCEECNIFLSSNYSLKRHSRVHTGDLPFSCKYCSASFRASDKLTIHIRNIHKGKKR